MSELPIQSQLRERAAQLGTELPLDLKLADGLLLAVAANQIDELEAELARARHDFARILEAEELADEIAREWAP